MACFIDEAGDRGYLRDLRPAQDHNICILCALPVPVEHLDYVRAQVKPLFDKFVAAAPEGAKHHITDAFRPGNEAWAQVARDVRSKMFSFMLQQQLRIVYAARRFKTAREMYELKDGLKQGMKASEDASAAPKTYAVHGINRPSSKQVDDQVMIDLSLLIDGFMENAERGLANFMFDEIDMAVADRYARMLERTRNVSYRRHDVTARNLVTDQNETRSIEMRANADFRLDTVHLGTIAVSGKSDPLIFAADVVANSLWRHLKQLAPDAGLNDGAALNGWELEPITFYDRSMRRSPMDMM